MSTIDVIISNLQSTSKEKSKSLEETYLVHAKWLQNELLLISKIIQQDPRDAIIITQEQPLIAEPENQSKKRKSPETAYGGPKLSPEQKRSSIDLDELLINAGLPIDPKRLTKQQLLNELEKRGNTSCTMKNTKDVLIEALKDCLVAEKRATAVSTDDNLLIATENASEPEPAISQDTIINTNEQVHVVDIASTDDVSAPINIDSPEIEDISTIPQPPAASPLKTPGRKGSLMQDFRTMVNTNQSAGLDAANEDSKRIQSEFKNRYRASQIRKSQVLEQPSIIENQEIQQVEQENVDEKLPLIESNNASAVTTQSANTEVEQDHSDSEHEKADSPEGESTWMEVSSPRRSSTQNECATLSSDVTPEEEVLKSTSDSTKSLDNKDSGSQKLVNLHVGQSSFLDKSATTKPIIPALEKAKQLKAAEELKALNKKKEQEQRTVKPSSSTVQTVAKMLSPNWKSKHSAVVKQSSEVNQPKKGLFGIFGAKKATATETKPSTFDISVVEAKKVAADSPKLETPSNSSTTATINSDNQEMKQDVTSTPLVVSKPTASSIIEKYNKMAAEMKDNASKDTSIQKLQESDKVQTFQEKTNDATSTPSQQVVYPQVPSIVAAPVIPAVISSQVELKVLQEIKQESSQAAPTSSSGIQRNVDAVEDVEEPREEYPIEDRGSSDDESGSGTDDEESNKKKQQKIPEWAQGQKLREALERQFGLNGHTPMDPDQIFPEVQTCSLEEIFGKREGLTRKYANRSSSAHWEPDQLTLVEKRQYRAHMGYGGKPPQASLKIH